MIDFNTYERVFYKETMGVGIVRFSDNRARIHLLIKDSHGRWEILDRVFNSRLLEELNIVLSEAYCWLEKNCARDSIGFKFRN